MVTRHFFHSGAFFVSEYPFWLALRDAHRASQWYLLALMLFLVALYAFWYRPLPSIAPHKVVYVCATFGLGAGVITHGLKLLIGRARPRHLLEFGGSVDFTPAWQMAGMCGKNCSFPSGEGASAAAMLSLLVFVPRRWRAISAAVLVPVLVLVSMNRVFMGAHFLSDVVVAWTLIISLMCWLQPRIDRKAEAIDGWVRLARSILGARLTALRQKPNVEIM